MYCSFTHSRNMESFKIPEAKGSGSRGNHRIRTACKSCCIAEDCLSSLSLPIGHPTPLSNVLDLLVSRRVKLEVMSGPIRWSGCVWASSGRYASAAEKCCKQQAGKALYCGTKTTTPKTQVHSLAVNDTVQSTGFRKYIGAIQEEPVTCCRTVSGTTDLNRRKHFNSWRDVGQGAIHAIRHGDCDEYSVVQDLGEHG